MVSNHKQQQPYIQLLQVVDDRVHDLRVRDSHEVFYELVSVAAMYLGFDVLSGQTLCDDVDALAVSQDMSSALRVVHQSFDAANQ